MLDLFGLERLIFGSGAAGALSRLRTYTPASKPPTFIFSFFTSFHRPAAKVSA